MPKRSNWMAQKPVLERLAVLPHTKPVLAQETILRLRRRKSANTPRSILAFLLREGRPNPSWAGQALLAVSEIEMPACVSPAFRRRFHNWFGEEALHRVRLLRPQEGLQRLEELARRLLGFMASHGLNALSEEELDLALRRRGDWTIPLYNRLVESGRIRGEFKGSNQIGYHVPVKKERGRGGRWTNMPLPPNLASTPREPGISFTRFLTRLKVFPGGDILRLQRRGKCTEAEVLDALYNAQFKIDARWMPIISRAKRREAAQHALDILLRGADSARDFRRAENLTTRVSQTLPRGPRK